MPSGKFITLRAKPYKDADLIIDALSSHGERVVFNAKNARKSKKRFSGGVLEPLNYSEFFYTQSRSGYFYIQEARVIYPFSGLRDDYKKLQTAFQLLKYITKGTKEGLFDNKSLFDLLGNGLRVLENAKNYELLTLHFEVKLLYFLGLFALGEETKEFVARPIKDHEKIELTRLQFLKLKQGVQKTLKEEFETPHSLNM